MKRVLSLAAVICLLAALFVPAQAATEIKTQELESTLTAIAADVKQTLEIGDDYTDFSGNYNDGLRPGWYMYWTKDDGELSVTCDENGIITEVYRWTSGGTRNSFYGFDAHFPSITKEDAQKQAEYWLKKLMGENERARIESVSVSLTEDGEYRFGGVILLRGLDSPISFSMSIDATGLISYDRSDSYVGYVGEIPEAKTGTDKKSASASLADAVRMELYYIADEDGQARLRYTPVGPFTVVDAQSGETVDMEALYAGIGGSYDTYAVRSMATEDAVAAEAGAVNGYALTEVELSAIANYADVLSQTELDAALRTLPGLNLDGFELTRCSFSMDGDEITASLRYTAEMTTERRFGFAKETIEEYSEWNDTLTVRKNITVNAKTGRLLSLSTSYPIWDDTRRPADDVETAERFLSAGAPEKWEEADLCTLQGVNNGDGLTFARVHDGYFFPQNYLYLEISQEGDVEEFRCEWDEDVQFASSKGIADEAEAIAAYVDALDVTLGYTAWPEYIDESDPVLARYSEWGYTYVESLRLAYYYDGLADIDGVDALTGEVISATQDGEYTYDDLSGCAEKSVIEALAEAGIGFDGGHFEPERRITQKEALTLLLQAEGYSVAGWDDERIRSQSVWMGFVEDSDWSPEAEVTGDEMIRMILQASIYRQAAELSGIWADEYDDSGYTAIAAALGMLPDNRNGSDACTRAQAAVLLYGFMTR